MIRKVSPFLALTMLLSAGTDPPSPDALETVRTAAYSHVSGYHPTANVLNWNIDRGKNLDGIEATMRRTEADLCIFQEVDSGARRTHGEDVAQEIARAFSMNFAFAPEFQELSQSTSAGAAFHGQAILTTLAIRSSRILRFKNQSGFWKPNPLMVSSLPLFQRRQGGRIAQIAELDNGGQLLVVYNLHLESKWYEHLRLLQLEEVLADAQRYSAETPIIIAGDFNTLTAHSELITRLNAAGYQNSFGDRRLRTHVLIGALDWVFMRGPLQPEDARVVRDTHASDHFPIALRVRF